MITKELDRGDAIMASKMLMHAAKLFEKTEPAIAHSYVRSSDWLRDLVQLSDKARAEMGGPLSPEVMSARSLAIADYARRVCGSEDSAMESLLIVLAAMAGSAPDRRSAFARVHEAIEIHRRAADELLDPTVKA